MNRLQEFQNFLKKYTDVISRVEYVSRHRSHYVMLEIQSNKKKAVDCINSLKKDYKARLCLSSTEDKQRYDLFLKK